MSGRRNENVSDKAEFLGAVCVDESVLIHERLKRFAVGAGAFHIQVEDSVLLLTQGFGLNFQVGNESVELIGGISYGHVCHQVLVCRIVQAHTHILVGVPTLCRSSKKYDGCNGRALALYGGRNGLAGPAESIINSPSLATVAAATVQADVYGVIILRNSFDEFLNVFVANPFGTAERLHA